jgi:uncharacterized protein with GYD domain
MRLTRCDDVLPPSTGGRPGLIIITYMMTKGQHDVVNAPETQNSSL